LASQEGPVQGELDLQLARLASCSSLLHYVFRYYVANNQCNSYVPYHSSYNSTSIPRIFSNPLIQFQSLKCFNQMFIFWLDGGSFLRTTLFECTRGQLHLSAPLGSVVLFNFTPLNCIKEMIRPGLRTTFRFRGDM
jgi:hypothetical protein